VLQAPRIRVPLAEEVVDVRGDIEISDGEPWLVNTIIGKEYRIDVFLR
jgi:hypothetical protein